MSNGKTPISFLVELVGKKTYLIFIYACFWISLLLLCVQYFIPHDIDVLIILSFFILVAGGAFTIFRICVFAIKRLVKKQEANNHE